MIRDICKYCEKVIQKFEPVWYHITGDLSCGEGDNRHRAEPMSEEQYEKFMKDTQHITNKWRAHDK